MKLPTYALQRIQRQAVADYSGKRYALIGTNEYVKSTFKRLLTPQATAIIEESIDPADVRESMLRIQDVMQTTPFQWEQPLIWIEGADHLFTQMSFPEDFPVSKHVVVCCSETEEIYVPASFLSVSITLKGAGAPTQDFIKWLILRKGMTTEIDILRFLAAEYKELLPALEKLLDQLYLKIHPRTTLMMKDLETGSSLEWDCEVILKALLVGDEAKVLKELNQALKTFHPKGIVTVLSRRVSLLIQVSAAVVLNAGAPDPSGDIRPWVWRNNVELVKEIPPQRLFKWAVSLDKAYSSLSRGSLSHRWVLFNMMADMSRI
jgi:hypothetical protein